MMHYTIGVVGAGTMGKGVAERFASYGHRVILYDIDGDVRNRALSEIERNIRLQSMFNRKGAMPDIKTTMGNIEVAGTYQDLSEADFIIENVREDMEVKAQVYENLDKICAPDCIYMANTSCISITRLGAGTYRASSVIGVHFMNPVPMKHFVEIIRGHHTSIETIERVCELLKGVGMEWEIIKDSPGFVSNRLSHLFMNEAAFLVYEGIAEPHQIDAIFKKAYHHKMGPLETADLIGLDTVLDSLKVLYEEYEDSKYRACPLLKKMVRAGLHGKKSGEGFYKY